MTPWLQSLTAALVLLLLALEFQSPQFRQDTFGPGPRRRRNWLFLAASLLPMVWVQHAGAWMRAHVTPVFPPGALGPVLDAVACIVVAELVSWLSHWVKHRSRDLWCFHFQHHREDHFSVWMVTHTHGLEVMMSGTAMVALLAWLSFSAFSVELYFSLYTVTLLYHHSARPYSLGFLDRWVVSPAYHRYHHRAEAQGNYGSVFTFFDLLFQTAHWPQREAEPARLGLAPSSPEPFGFLKELLWFTVHRKVPRA